MAVHPSPQHNDPGPPPTESRSRQAVMIRRSWALAAAAGTRRSTSVDRSGVTEPMTDVSQQRAA